MSGAEELTKELAKERDIKAELQSNIQKFADILNDQDVTVEEAWKRAERHCEELDREEASRREEASHQECPFLHGIFAGDYDYDGDFKLLFYKTHPDECPCLHRIFAGRYEGIDIWGMNWDDV